jgi:2-polyprenyl-3-methyl-5-hydroxy-6-metoxy-1,4-benzoquinol methylase
MTDDYSAIYDPDTDVDVLYTRATADRIARWLRPGDRVLELGCATGAMTAALAADDRVVVAVDRAESYLVVARERGLPGVTWLEADFGTALPATGVHDHVVLTNVLHELDDPAGTLAAVAAEHLAPGGVVHVSLQNPHSLHRLVALEMGLIDSLSDVSANGQKYATRRLYTVAELTALAAGAGLEVAHREGVMLKPLPNDAMAALGADVLAGFAAAAKHLPDHGAMNLLHLRHAG